MLLLPVITADKHMFEKLRRNVRGMADAGAIGGILIGVSIALIVAAAILPTAIVDITNTTKFSGAPAAVLTLVPILGIVVIASIAFMLYKRLVD